MGLLGEPERENHHEARKEQEGGRSRGRLQKAAHHEGVVGGTRGLPFLPAVPGGERHAHEVHEVVARKGEREGERTRQNDDLEDVDAEDRDEYLEEHRQAREEREEDDGRVGVDPLDPLGTHEARALGALHHEEVDDGRERDAAVDGADAAVGLLELEGEDEAGEILDDGARNEGDDDGDQNARDDAERLARIDVVGDVGERSARVDELEERGGKGGAHELEHDRDRGRRRETERIEGVKQDDVRYHDSEKHDHQLGEGEELRMEDAGAGDLHHARGERRAREHADRGDPERRAEGGDAGRIQKVDGVVRDADEKVNDCDDPEEGQQHQIVLFHVRCKRW